MVIDPETLIAAALAIGAAAGTKTIATEAVRDAYSALKSKLQRRFATADVARVESAPESLEIRRAFHEELKAVKAGDDAEILGLSRAILDAVEASAIAKVIGVDLEGIRAASLTIEEVDASDVGVKVREADVRGDVTIRSVRAGAGERHPKS